MDVQRSIRSKIPKYKKQIDQIAEIGWQEYQTQTYIKKEIGLPLWEKKTALIYSVGKGKPVFFRSELDGLPTEKGIRHACGHSSHMAALMAAYLYFRSHPVEGFLIYFVFQPAEENYPSGATFIIKNFPQLSKASLGVAFHVFPDAIKGQLIDSVFASADYFKITLIGKGTHIKNKYQIQSDVLTIGSQLAVKINKIKSKYGLINVGVFRSGEVANRIAGEAVLEGDIRALKEKTRKALKQKLDLLVEQTRMLGVEIDYFFNQGYELLENSPQLIKSVRTFLPINGVLKSFASEDFSLYTNKKLFLLIGSGGKTELHESDFEVSTDVAQKIFDYWIQVGNNLPRLV